MDQIEVYTTDMIDSELGQLEFVPIFDNEINCEINAIAFETIDFETLQLEQLDLSVINFVQSRRR